MKPVSTCPMCQSTWLTSAPNVSSSNSPSVCWKTKSKDWRRSLPPWSALSKGLLAVARNVSRQSLRHVSKPCPTPVIASDAHGNSSKRPRKGSHDEAVIQVAAGRRLVHFAYGGKSEIAGPALRVAIRLLLRTERWFDAMRIYGISQSSGVERRL